MRQIGGENSEPIGQSSLARGRQAGGKWGNTGVLKLTNPNAGTGSARSRKQQRFQPKGNMMQTKTSKMIGGMLALSLALSLAATTGQAQSQPSAKVTAKTANLTLVGSTTGQEWSTLLSNTIKTANQKDLFINASFEVGLYTQTQVASKNMVKDTSTAESTVQVRVLLDGKVVEPGNVVYGRRKQTL